MLDSGTLDFVFEDLRLHSSLCMMDGNGGCIKYYLPVDRKAALTTYEIVCRLTFRHALDKSVLRKVIIPRSYGLLALIHWKPILKMCWERSFRHSSNVYELFYQIRIFWRSNSPSVKQSKKSTGRILNFFFQVSGNAADETPPCTTEAALPFYKVRKSFPSRPRNGAVCFRGGFVLSGREGKPLSLR